MIQPESHEVPMSSLALSQLGHDVREFVHVAASRWETFLNSVSEARRMADNFRSLSRLSDDELAHRGLKREDIPNAVFRGKRR
jgi:uncharacterized protein YjiS (DUF1127 family)